MSTLVEIRFLIRNQAGKVYTHSGRFHADDVFACALAGIVAGNPVTPVRLGKPEDLNALGISDENALVFDIGYGRFDHHQSRKEFTDDGVEKSAVMKLWEFLGPEFIKAAAESRGVTCPQGLDMPVFERVTEELIKPISDTDTKGQSARPNLISRMIENRATSGAAPMNQMFEAAVQIAEGVILDWIVTAIKSVQSEKTAKVLAEAWMAEGHPSWGYSEVFVPAAAFKGTDVKFIVGKSPRGGYNIACVDAGKYPIGDLPAPRKGTFWANFDTWRDAMYGADTLAFRYGLQEASWIEGLNKEEEEE